MCDPVTLTILTIAAVTSAGLSAYGQQQQGKYQEKMAKYQADLDMQRAGLANEQAGAESIEQGMGRRQQLGAARVAAAGGGALLDASPQDAVQMWERDQSALGAYDTAKISRDAELQQWGFLASANATRAQGKMARWSGNLGAVSSIIGGAGQAAGFGAKAYSSNRANQRLASAQDPNYDYSGVEN